MFVVVFVIAVVVIVFTIAIVTLQEATIEFVCGWGGCVLVYTDSLLVTNPTTVMVEAVLHLSLGFDNWSS